ncbi:MAG: hypothetical protein NTU48_02390 [Legionellales bacterium]|nr:hypothetical protein [Legionellales bacterium]
MKKSLFIGFLFFSTATWAGILTPFFIKITNTLATDCKLKDQIILDGHVSDHTSIPTILHPNQSETFKMRPDPHQILYFQRKTILLTYVCGSEQAITLYSSANTVSFANPEGQYVDAKTFYEQNMQATYEKSGQWWQHPTLSWALTY